MAEKEEKNVDSLKEYLYQWEKAGIRLYLDGTAASAEKIGKICVNEDTMYMPDYVTDKEGKIKEIRYNRISQK